MARANKGIQRGDSGPKGHQAVGEADPDAAYDQDDLQDDLKGRNSLQGNDQRNVHNQRHAVAKVRQKTEGVVESFEKMDPKERRRD